MSVLDETWHETRARLRDALGRTHALEDSADNTRTLLRLALEDRYGGRRSNAWLEDFGEDWVVFHHSYRDANDRHQDDTVRVKYSISDGKVTFHGEPERVRTRVEYVDQQVPEQARAFKLEVGEGDNAKTIITGPAAAFLEKASSPNPMFLNIMGRFVGAEKANRNKALWTTDDLVFGQPTVKNGPLNWLHEERHIVGAITEAALLTPTEASDGGETEPPYIAAAASMWKWLWPNESAVVEMAAASGNLWYSMECVSETVICHGENGCGTEVAYLDALTKSDKCCQHLRERSSERRFKEPTFLGGAVIVPPVRPGWDKANARVLSEAAQYSEKAYEQAGQPDVPSSDWDRLMAQVLTYAKG